jgi:hypothetical protein
MIHKALIPVSFLFCCLAAFAGTSARAESDLFRQLVASSVADDQEQILVTFGMSSDAEAVLDALMADGFRPDIAHFDGVTYQNCGPYVVPVSSTDKYGGVDRLLLNRFETLFSPRMYRISLSIAERCVVTNASGWRFRPSSL